jgi:hypothetical protein
MACIFAPTISAPTGRFTVNCAVDVAIFGVVFVLELTLLKEPYELYKYTTVHDQLDVRVIALS